MTAAQIAVTTTGNIGTGVELGLDLAQGTAMRDTVTTAMETKCRQAMFWEFSGWVQTRLKEIWRAYLRNSGA